MAQKSALSFQNWKELFKGSFVAFPRLWWRIAAVNVLTVLALILGSAIIMGIGYLLFKDSVESFIANMQFGGMPQNIALIAILGLIWILFVLAFSIVGKIANWLTVRNDQKKKTRNPFGIYFKEAWKYFWRYVGVGLRMIWYIVWPVAIVVFVAGIIGHFVPEFPIQVWGAIFSGLLVAWRSTEVFLAPILLIQYDKSAKASVETSIKLVRGNWWRVFWAGIIFFALLSLSRVIFFIPDFVHSFGWDFSQSNLLDYSSNTPQQYAPSFWVALDGLYAFFVLAPLFMAFPYLLMLQLTKAKKLKP